MFFVEPSTFVATQVYSPASLNFTFDISIFAVFPSKYLFIRIDRSNGLPFLEIALLYFFKKKIREERSEGGELGLIFSSFFISHLNQVGVGLGVPLMPHSRYSLPFILPLVSRRLRLKDGYVLGDALLILIVRATDPSNWRSFRKEECVSKF